MTRVIAVAGGKGGAGKTAVAVNLAVLLSRRHRVLLVDADVDNPCTATLLTPEVDSVEEVKEFKPVIDLSLCTACGACSRACPEHAILVIPGKEASVAESLCSGCGVCRLVCPSGAIKPGYKLLGRIRRGRAAEGPDLLIGELEPTSKRSAVLAVELLERLRAVADRYDYVIVDSPPGTGAAVYVVLSAAGQAVLVTEPTRLGIWDLERCYSLSSKVISGGTVCVLNKYGMPGADHREAEEALSRLGLEWIPLPYDEHLIRAHSSGRPVVLAYPDSPASKALERLAALLEQD